MTLSPRLTAAIANAMLDNSIGGSIANSGKLRVYDGTQPSSGGGAITTQNLLVEFILNATAFPAASGGILTANAIAPVTAALSGSATWFRMTKSDGSTVLIDGSAGVGAGFDCQLDNATIVAGGTVTVTSCTITQPLA